MYRTQRCAPACISTKSITNPLHLPHTKPAPPDHSTQCARHTIITKVHVIQVHVLPPYPYIAQPQYCFRRIEINAEAEICYIRALVARKAPRGQWRGHEYFGCLGVRCDALNEGWVAGRYVLHKEEEEFLLGDAHQGYGRDIEWRLPDGMERWGVAE